MQYKHTAIIILFIFAYSFFSCSKKNITDNKSTDNQPKTQSSSQQNTNFTSGQNKFFSVKSSTSGNISNQMVDFTWAAAEKEEKLSDFKGSVILLNFWATWCPPCRKELPALSQISSQLKDKGFKMIGVSVDENPQTLESFLNSNSLSYTILHDKTDLVSKYMSVTGGLENVIPQTYLIDKNGKIVEVIIGSRSKEEFLKLINKYL